MNYIGHFMGDEDKKKPRRLFLRSSAAVLVLLLAGGLVFWLTLPDVTWLAKTNPTETAMMGFRAEQSKLKGLRARRFWKRVPLSRISPCLIQAVLIAEDDKFFAHEGFDWESMRGALESNIGRKRGLRGGSTITQQLAKNLFLSSEQSIWRKLREAAIAWKLEGALSKKRILELYLNVIDWGTGIYGAEAAAPYLFRPPGRDADRFPGHPPGLHSPQPAPFLGPGHGQQAHEPQAPHHRFAACCVAIGSTKKPTTRR